MAKAPLGRVPTYLLMSLTIVRHNFTKLNVSSATTLQAIHRRCRWVIAGTLTCWAFICIISDYWQSTLTHASSTR